MATADVIATVQFLADQYNAQPPAGQLDFWIEALSEYPPDVLRRAAVTHIKTSKWMPKLSEILELCKRDNEANYEQHLSEHKQMWMLAMDALSLYMQGRITETQLERDKAYVWFMRNSAQIDWNEAALIQERENEEARASLQAQGIPESEWNRMPEGITR